MQINVVNEHQVSNMERDYNDKFWKVVGEGDGKQLGESEATSFVKVSCCRYIFVALSTWDPYKGR